MKCSHAKLLISWGMDEPLPEYERTQLETHVQACSPCARYATHLERGRTLLARATAAPPDNFEWKVQLKIQQALREAAARVLPAGARPGFWLPAGVTAALTALVVVAVGGLLLFDPAAWRGSTSGALQPGGISDQPLASASTERPNGGDDSIAAGTGPTAGGESGTATPAAVDRRAPSAVRRPLLSSPAWSGLGNGPVQEVSGGTAIVQDEPLPWQMLDPARLAERDRIEHELLVTQRQADKLRRMLDDFEVGGIDSVPAAARVDTVTSAIAPRR